MEFPLSAPLASRFEFLVECGSTNTELVDRAADAWPDFSVLVTTSQTAGRGRLDRVWVAPPGQALAVSVLLRPTFSLDAFGWLPLVAGLAMARAVDSVGVAGAVSLKWPNDVLVDGLKVSGLLAELLPGAAGVVLGAGVNLTIPRESLPTPQSTSLGLLGAAEEGLADRVLAAYLGELHGLYAALGEHGGDADASGIRRLVVERCSTVGRQVRVELPGGRTLFGTANDIDPAGRLTVVDREDGAVQTVAAGDVTHLRYE
jgi:BirA family biotin operon repressor/biotin-[acetyl-CoA-carboxylase] ligase